MQLHSISYTSSATRIPSQGDLQALLEKARAVNAQEQVTGVLIYADGNFHQYIEGPKAGLARVYARILASTLHTDIFELLSEPIERREFTDWTMGFQSASAPAEDRVLARMLASDGGSLSAGRLLLNAFWEKAACRLPSCRLRGV